jgi:hypothetical protein
MIVRDTGSKINIISANESFCKITQSNKTDILSKDFNHILPEQYMFNIIQSIKKSQIQIALHLKTLKIYLLFLFLKKKKFLFFKEKK